MAVSSLLMVTRYCVRRRNLRRLGAARESLREIEILSGKLPGSLLPDKLTMYIDTACRRGARHRRLVAAEPAFSGERGSPPLTLASRGTAPHGCRGKRGACRRHVAVHDRAEGARLSARRGGSSTSPAAECRPRGSLVRLRDCEIATRERTTLIGSGSQRRRPSAAGFAFRRSSK